MNFKEFTDKALRTMDDSLPKKEAISMICMGLAGETGEIVDYLKKVCYHGKEFDRENLVLELGDLMWYFAILANIYGIGLDEVYEKNVEKLWKRYPDGFKKQSEDK